MTITTARPAAVVNIPATYKREPVTIRAVASDGMAFVQRADGSSFDVSMYALDGKDA